MEYNRHKWEFTAREQTRGSVDRLTKRRHKEQGDFVLKAVQGDKISRAGGFLLKLEDKAQRMRPR